MDTIDIDSRGNATVCGDKAHFLWDYCKGEFPRTPQRHNYYFVMEPIARGKGIVRAAQTTLTGALRYMAENRVLITVENPNVPNGQTL
jgi:hypothetical protein